MKRISKYIIAPLLTTLVLTAALSGCSRESDSIDGNTRGGFRFEVRMESRWSDAIGVQTRSSIEGTSFPGSAVGVVYRLGLSILKSDGVTPYVLGADNILAELTVQTGATDRWRYQLKGSPTWLTELPTTNLSEAQTIAAYYPYSESTTLSATNTDVPFDLTETSRVDQSDVLYTLPKAVNAYEVNTLEFKHFYSLFDFRIKTAVANQLKLSTVAISNAPDKNWVVSTGKFNARTGNLVDNITPGEVCVIGLNKELTTTDYQTVQVMVPSRAGAMNAFADGDIKAVFYFDSGVSAFNIQRSWLFSNGSTGLTGGKKYSFQLIYDPRPEATAALTLLSWGTGCDIEEAIAVPPVIEFGLPPFKNTDNITGGSTTQGYNDYTIGANGGYAGDITAAYSEKPYYKLEIAKQDDSYAASGNNYWEKAWNACKNKTTGGGGWRLPRASELALMILNKGALESLPDFSALSAQYYWSGKEYNDGNAWVVESKNSDGRYSFNKISRYEPAVRCVREL